MVSSTPSSAAATGSARLRVQAAVTLTQARLAENSRYATAVAARPSHAIRQRVAPSRSGPQSLIIQGSRASEPTSRDGAEVAGRSAAGPAAAN